MAGYINGRDVSMEGMYGEWKVSWSWHVGTYVSMASTGHRTVIMI